MNPGHSTAAIIMIVFSALSLATMDASIKYIGGVLSLAIVVWSRFTIQAAMLGLWIWRFHGRSGFRTEHPRFQILRGALLVATSACSFFALRHIPLAEFTAIMMLSPVLVTAFAGLFQHQAVGPMRWALVSGGFIGTLIVMRPGSGLFGIAVLLPLLSMMIATAYSLLTSRLARLDSPYTTQFYSGVTGSLLFVPVVAMQADDLLPVVANLEPRHFGLLLAIGVLGTVGHLLLVMAFSKVRAAMLMPFTYIQIAFAAMMSWIVFRHAPDFWAWVGMIIIALCGAATAWLNLSAPPRSKLLP